jgi:hypothetical protein
MKRVMICFEHIKNHARASILSKRKINTFCLLKYISQLKVKTYHARENALLLTYSFRFFAIKYLRIAIRKWRSTFCFNNARQSNNSLATRFHKLRLKSITFVFLRSSCVMLHNLNRRKKKMNSPQRRRKIK